MSIPHASIGFVATYPPTVCGIASYTASLVGAISQDRSRLRRLGVVALGEDHGDLGDAGVVFRHRRGDRASLETAVRALNSYDAVSIQHEYGIFAGPDGEEVMDLLEGLTVPIAVTLHTVLSDPTAPQRAIIDGIGRLADRLVVMSQTAADRLVATYRLDPSSITVVPHGADDQFARPSLAAGRRPLVLTWGLIGPGKGLEWAIEAFADLVDLEPRPRYLIAGATHPQVLRHSGESYRDSLRDLTNRLDIGGLIEFDNRYLSRTALAAVVRSADVVVLPYESVEQVTSGVLVEAIAASKPVVATPFPHAVELLSGGAGSIVPYGEPAALAGALRGLLSNPAAMRRMTTRAQVLAREWYWPTVGRRFADVMSQIAADSSKPQPLVVSGGRLGG